MQHAITSNPASAPGFLPGVPGLAPKALSRRAAQRRQWLGIITLSYLVDTLICAAYSLAGATSPLVPFSYLVAISATSALFFLLSETHLNDRFADHVLSGAQNGVAAAIQIAFLYLAPEIGFAFLCCLFVICSFSALRCSVRQAAITWTLIALGLASFFLLGDRPIGMPAGSHAERAATMMCFVLAIGRCMFVGLHGSALREALSRRRDELRAANRRIEELARIDDLTGALNRRTILQQTADEIRRAQRVAQPCAIALIDLDWFKKINDTYGHPAGDEALRTFAIAVFANIRDTDRFGRYGGEEFLLLLPHTDAHEAQRSLERLRSVVADLDWTAIVPGASLTMSVGVTAIDPKDTVEAALSRADIALYKAKAAGRNRVVAG